MKRYPDSRASSIDRYAKTQNTKALERLGVRRARDALGEDELMKLMAEGSTWSEDRAVAEAMLI